MMTGDNDRTASVIANAGRRGPLLLRGLARGQSQLCGAEKAAGHTVIMLGDGINDSPALSAADVGIAISDGAAIAREIADITIAADSLRELVILKSIANGLQKRTKSNYRFIIFLLSSVFPHSWLRSHPRRCRRHWAKITCPDHHRRSDLHRFQRADDIENLALRDIAAGLAAHGPTRRRSPAPLSSQCASVRSPPCGRRHRRAGRYCRAPTPPRRRPAPPSGAQPIGQPMQINSRFSIVSPPPTSPSRRRPGHAGARPSAAQSPSHRGPAQAAGG